MLGRDVRQRALDEADGLRRLGLARDPGGQSEVGYLHLSRRGIDDDVGRLEILVDDVPAMHLGHRLRDGDREAKEPLHLHRRAEQAIERLAAGVLRDQGRHAAQRLE
ncbi:MAG: hypothetical protein QM820_48080 [Minicystis sp.]